MKFWRDTNEMMATEAFLVLLFLIGFGSFLSGWSGQVYPKPKLLSGIYLTRAIVIAQTQGLRYLSTLAGLVFFSHQVGGFLGAWLDGKLYDSTGDYQAMWVAAIVLGLIATVLHLSIRETPGALAKAEAS